MASDRHLSAMEAESLFVPNLLSDDFLSCSQSSPPTVGVLTVWIEVPWSAAASKRRVGGFEQLVNFELCSTQMDTAAGTSPRPNAQ